MYLVGAATRELAFEYHDKGYIALEANLGFEDGKTISFSQGGNTVTATDDENGFSEDDIGKYIYTGDGWHKILSVSDVTIVGRGKNIADVVSPYQVASEPPASVISTITPGSIEMSVNAAINSTWVAWRIFWPVKPETNYTISAKMECDDDSFTPSLGVYSKTGISGTVWYKSGLKANGSVTVNTNDNNFIGLYLHFTGDTGNSGARTVRYYDIQIEEGSTATAYEPYHDIPFLALDNAQGQVQSVAVEAGCRARQETRKNLLKPPGDATVGGVTYTLQDNGTYLANGTVAGMGLMSLYKGVLPAGQYTISGGAGGIQVALSVYKADGTYIRTICASNGGATQTGTVTGLTGEEAYHQAFIQAVSTIVGQTVTNVVLSPQLERGDTATAFEPYKSILPITGRENVEIAACGKNLLKPQGDATVGGVTYTLQDNGTYLANGTVTSTGFLAMYKGVLPPGKYTISGGAGGLQVALSVYKADGAYIRTICASHNGASETGTVTELTGEEAYHQAFIQAVRTTVGQTVTNVVLSPQLETGGTATAFEPYRSMGGGTVTPTEPLYGLPGAEDTVEVSVDGDVTVTRRTAALELDGTENWILGIKNDDGYYWRLSIADIYQITTSVLPNIICSHYQTETPDAQWVGSVSCISQDYNASLRTYVAIYDTNYAESDLSAWKAYLAAQYAAGTPVTIVYELAAPETEAPADVDPIEPNTGEVNVFTDADSLNITLYKTENNKYASVTGSFSQTQNDFASMLTQMNEISISGEDVELTKLGIDYVPQVR